MNFFNASKRMSKFILSKEFQNEAKEEAPETLPLIIILSDINKNGLITVDSQPGKHIRGKTFDIHQRSYLLGFMESSKAQLMNQSFSIEDKVMIIIHVDKTASMDDFKSKFDIPLTIDPSFEPTKIITHTSASIPQIVFDSYKKQAKLSKRLKTEFVLFFDSKYNRVADGKNGLFTCVLHHLKAIS